MEPAPSAPGWPAAVARAIAAVDASQGPTPGRRASLLARLGKPHPRDLIDLDDGTIAYARAGDGGPTLVLVHGALTSLDDMLLALVDHLPGRQLLAFDRPGFGFSDRRVGIDAGILAQAQRLNQALDALGVGQAILIGHSFGAAVALAMALAAPERALGVVALAPLVMPEWRLEHLLFAPRAAPVSGGWLAGWSHAGLDPALLPFLWRAMFLPQAMPEHVEAAFPFALAGAAAATRHVGEDCAAAGPGLMANLARVARFSRPLAVLGGATDLVINNRRHGQVLAALAPLGRFELSPGVGHMIHHAAPSAVARAVRAIEASILKPA